MDKIIIIPLIISVVLLVNRGPKEVFILVFLPTLTLFPSYFSTELIKGTPELYFWSAALVPILAVWALRGCEGYNYHWMDMVVLSYILMVFYGQLSNSDYKQAQKVLFNNMMSIFFPYLMVRSFCKDRDTMVKLIRMITILGAVVALFNIYESRMFINYFDKLLRAVWPHSVMWDTGLVMSRWGFKRALGPFSHPIVAGYVFSLISPLAIWCYFQNYYKNKNIGKLVVFLNVMGLIVSISRAPMIGFILGLMIIIYGWSRNKAIILSVIGIILSITLMVAVPKFITYMSVTRATAETYDQRNVAYRKEMWEAYIDVAMERPYVGWGRFTVPAVRGMKSIDSEYLGIALASGIIAVGFYLIFLLGTLAILIRYALSKNHDSPNARLAWCLIAGWVSAIFSQCTVYSGAQSVQYLFMLAGIGCVLVHSSENVWLSLNEQAGRIIFPESSFGFKRIV